MHVLLRGSVVQRLRLASGLVLFAFAGAHFTNHAMGLVSLEAMHQMQDLRTALTRSTAGTVVLTAALATHIGLGLYKLAARNTLRMPLWEALQIAIALAIPFLLFPHIVNTRIANVFYGVDDTYLYELARLWPDRAVIQSTLLLLVWSHGCIGLHYWLRLTQGYHEYRWALWTVAALVPVLGIAGFAASGRLTAEIMSDAEALAALKQRSNWPSAADGAAMAGMRDLAQYGFGALLAAIAGVYAGRRLMSRAHTGLAVSYRDGPTVAASPGMTLLEISRANGVPHASVCGGRARCFTCRVKVETGLESLPAPGRAEAIALRALEAPANVRLACQLRPAAPLTVTVLNKPAVPGPVQVEFVEVKSVVTAHARAVLSHETVDLESRDAEAVSRWFAGKITYPVTVPGLDGSRFALRGGRVDYLQDRPVATLAYGRNEHPISLYVLPSNDADALMVRGNRNGYSVVGWADPDFAYFAASDLDRKILDELQDAFSAAKAGTAERPVAPSETAAPATIESPMDRDARRLP
ncbi:MAG: adenylate/guanylate cyclase domain-containing protein [Bradyrhizobiaceae bacterium]|nr:MAG: adenylate/guanylate cyclase domain-containing protein [Bradyrhizobiaceae bacterium]